MGLVYIPPDVYVVLEPWACAVGKSSLVGEAGGVVDSAERLQVEPYGVNEVTVVQATGLTLVFSGTCASRRTYPGPALTRGRVFFLHRSNTDTSYCCGR